MLSLTLGGTKHAVNYYPQLVALLRQAAGVAAANVGNPAAANVQLEVQASAIPEDRDDDAAAPETAPPPAPVRQVQMPLAAATALAGTAGERQFMHSLGLASSELTVGRATAGAKDVLQRGDILLSFNGKPLTDVFSLREQLIAATSPSADFTVLRDFHQLPVKVQLKSLEAQRPRRTRYDPHAACPVPRPAHRAKATDRKVQ